MNIAEVKATPNPTRREFVTLLDGTQLRVGDKCRAQIGLRWRAGTVVEIMQGTGVDRVFIAVKSGTKLGPIGRYRLRRVPTTSETGNA